MHIIFLRSLSLTFFLSPSLSRWFYRLSRLPTTPRTLALSHLLRIELEGAFAGLVSGSPTSSLSPTQIISLDSTTAIATDNDNDTDTSIGIMSKNTATKETTSNKRTLRQATNIVSNVTRWRRRLEWTLNNLPKPTKLSSMDPPLRLLLCIGLYELLDINIPAHAINEYVDIAKSVMHEGCGKVCNGVLRTVVRCREQGIVPAVPPPPPNASVEDVVARASVKMSHPTWMVRKWVGTFGVKETLRLLAANNQRPRYAVRLSLGDGTANGDDDDDFLASLKRTIDSTTNALEEYEQEEEDSSTELSIKKSKYLGDQHFIVIESGLQQFLASGVMSQGKAQVQDEAAALVVLLALNPQPNDTVLDCCAAPGGKTLFAAALMQYHGRLVALDSSNSRLKAVYNHAKRQGIDTDRFLTCVPQDARQYCFNAAASDDYFDRVLVDAPCSGTGVLAKRADLRWKRSEEDLNVLCALQRELLLSAAVPVKPHGGVLVYSTCSLEREENEDQIEWFLNHTEIGNEFVLDHILNSDNSNALYKECVSEDGVYLKMMPHVHGTDGAFAARLIRK